MRLVDADRLFPDVMKVDGSMAISQGQLAHAHTVDAIPKTEYENRLKADMVAMLKELKKDIIELPFPQREPEYMQGYSYCQMNVLDYVIQQKINALRGNE